MSTRTWELFGGQCWMERVPGGAIVCGEKYQILEARAFSQTCRTFKGFAGNQLKHNDEGGRLIA